MSQRSQNTGRQRGDGTQSDLDRDLGVYMELARNYQRRKKWPRVFGSLAWV